MPYRFVWLGAWLSAMSVAAPLTVNTRWVFPTRPDPRWELKPLERTRPVLVGDILYATNLEGVLYAVHRTEGYVLWKKKLPAAVEGALTYGRSKIFVGDSQGNLIALHARDGSEAWRFKVGAEWLSPPFVSRDKVFVATSSDELYALSETTGKELWHYSRRGDEKMTVRGTSSPVAFGPDVFHGFSDGYLVSLSAADGKLQWAKKLRLRDRFYDIDAAPYVDDQSVIAATFDGRVTSLSKATGEVQWAFPVGSYGGFYAEGDRLFFAGLDGHFYALARSTGALVWKRPYPKGVGMMPVKVGEYLAFATSADPIYLIDPASGEVVWSGRLGAGTMAAIAAAPEGWFYCLSNYGVLYSFEIQKNADTPRGPETVRLPSAIQRLAKPTGPGAT